MKNKKQREKIVKEAEPLVEESEKVERIIVVEEEAKHIRMVNETIAKAEEEAINVVKEELRVDAAMEEARAKAEEESRCSLQRQSVVRITH